MIAEENTVNQKNLERVVKKTGSQQLNREDVKDRCKLRESIKKILDIFVSSRFD